MAKLFFKTEDNLISLFLDSPNQPVNSVAGEIVVPAGMAVEQIQSGNSMISFWIDSPALKEGKIIFAGIIPGGYQGVGGKIFSFFLSADSKTVSNLIEVEKAQVLIHDGLGTEATVETPSIIFRPVDNFVATTEDLIPPEEFGPLISADSTIFAGAKFLVFQAQDKQSGIDHYEVKEGRQSWQTASSPYLIINQNLTERIQVKAVDLAGNERVVTALSPSWGYLNYGFFVTIVIVLGLCFFILKKVFRHF